jgi:hypothetical protein
MFRSIEKLFKNFILFGILLDSLDIEYQAMWYAEGGGLVERLFGGGQCFAANDTVSFSVGVLDLKVTEFDIVEASPDWKFCNWKFW